MGNKHNKDSRAGLYTTLIFHLSAIIIMLLVSINSIVNQESSFLMDFSLQEQREEEEKEIEKKEEIKKSVDELIASAPRQSIRNVAVDANENLKDDRFKNSREVYDEARALQKKLDQSRREALAQEKDENSVDMGTPEKKEDNSSQSSYKGPSVISYRLDGRKAQYLPVPAYKGYGSGDVTVEITVNRSGRVTGAKVVTARSTSDISLHEFAIEAAKRSRFSASSTADNQQKGEIVYRFIAQ